MKLKKILLIVYMFGLITFANTNISNAFNPKSFSSIYNGGGTTRFIGWGNIIVGIIQTGAVAVLVISLLVMAIKLMYASVEEKAEIKKHAIPYIIGSMLIFGTTAIVSIVAEMGKSLN